LGHRERALPDVDRQQQFTLGVHGDPDPLRRTLQARDGLSRTDRTVFDCAEEGEEFVQLHLLDPHVVQDMLGEGAQLLGRLDEPLQHGIEIDLEHPCGAADAQSLGQARHDAHDEVNGGALSMKNRAQGLQKIAATGDAQELPPGTAIGMAIGAELPPAHPAAIGTGRVGADMG